MFRNNNVKTKPEPYYVIAYGSRYKNTKLDKVNVDTEIPYVMRRVFILPNNENVMYYEILSNHAHEFYNKHPKNVLTLFYPSSQNEVDEFLTRIPRGKDYGCFVVLPEDSKIIVSKIKVLKDTHPENHNSFIYALTDEFINTQRIMTFIQCSYPHKNKEIVTPGVPATTNLTFLPTELTEQIARYAAPTMNSQRMASLLGSIYRKCKKREAVTDSVYKNSMSIGTFSK